MSVSTYQTTRLHISEDTNVSFDDTNHMISTVGTTRLDSQPVIYRRKLLCVRPYVFYRKRSVHRVYLRVSYGKGKDIPVTGREGP
jgi:hypothetical protein